MQKRKPKNNGPSQAKAASAPNGGPPNAIPGPGVPERLGDEKSPLRLVIVGHNPSEEAWRRGHFYAHKSNRCESRSLSATTMEGVPSHLDATRGSLPLAQDVANPEGDGHCAAVGTGRGGRRANGAR